MSTVSQVESAVSTMVNETTQTQKKTAVKGRTVGNPTLSEAGAKYYEELKKKFSGMDFVLVSRDMKQAAQAQAGKFANPSKMVVLIDEDKIERMATDEKYRKQYEAIIQNGSRQMPSLQKSLAPAGSAVKGYGMKVNDGGTASFFAVVDKSLAAQKKRIAKKSAEKKEADKKADKKEAEKAREERLEERRAERSAESDEVMVTASSIEELIQKVNDILMGGMSDTVQTEEELMVGQNFDFKL